MTLNKSNTFKGLSLQPGDAFRQIAIMIEAGMIFSVSDLEDSSDLSDFIFQQARLYAEAANDLAMEKLK